MDGDAQQARQTPVSLSKRALEHQIRLDAVLVRSLRLKEASQLLGIGRDTVKRLIKHGELKAYRQGRCMWMVPMWAIKEYQQREIDRAAGGGNLHPILAEQAARARGAREMVNGMGAAVQA